MKMEDHCQQSLVHVVPGKVFHVTIGKISSGQLFYNDSTHFTEVQGEEFACQSAKEFLTSEDLKTFSHGDLVYQVFIMKVAGKYLPKPSKKGVRRGGKNYKIK